MTGAKVFDIAVALMDEQNVRGESDVAENADFKNRTLQLLAVVGAECAMRCAPFGTMFIPPETLSAELPFPEELCAGVMPYGLAALLTLESAPEVSGVFLRRYQDALTLYASTHGTVLETIEDVYGMR